MHDREQAHIRFLRWRAKQEREATSTGSYRLPFGKYKGVQLADVAEVNVGYIDWLLGQDWLYESTKQRVLAFARQPWVTQALNDRFWVGEPREPGRGKPRNGALGTIHAQGVQVTIWDDEPITKVFIPSEQKTRLFNLGKRILLRPEWRDPALPPLFDPDRRPVNMIVVNTQFAKKRGDIIRKGRLTEQEAELAMEPLPGVLTLGRAWQLMATIDLQLDTARSKQDVPAATLPEAKQLQEYSHSLCILPSVREWYRRLPAEEMGPPEPTKYYRMDADFLQQGLRRVGKYYRRHFRGLRLRLRLRKLRRIAYRMFDPAI
jgi:hypothetical protein